MGPDLDLAGHVNNTSYVEWAVEAVPDEIWDIQERSTSWRDCMRMGEVAGCVMKDKDIYGKRYKSFLQEMEKK